MKLIYRIALSGLLLFSLGLNGYFLYQNHLRNNVVSVHDGDTFSLGDGQRVRLLGVNTPELGNCFAQEARNKLSQLALGKTVRIREEKRDTYGRRMGLVYTGNTLINEVLLNEGFARPDYAKNSQSERLKIAYARASTQQVGIHSSICKKIAPVPPSANCTIKGNIDKGTWDHLYHLPTCRHYNQIILDTDMGEGFFCSEKEAKNAGFTLAPDCLR